MTAFNETTQKAYQGGNVEVLETVMDENGYDEERGWATFRQWLAAGRVVIKGQKGTHINRYVKVDKDSSVTLASDEDNKRLARKTFVVFHFDQTQVLEKKEGN